MRFSNDDFQCNLLLIGPRIRFNQRVQTHLPRNSSNVTGSLQLTNMSRLYMSQDIIDDDFDVFARIFPRESVVYTSIDYIREAFAETTLFKHDLDVSKFGRRIIVIKTLKCYWIDILDTLGKEWKSDLSDGVGDGLGGIGVAHVVLELLISANTSSSLT